MKKYDVGIVGESLLAPFIAGLLKKNHQKKTCLFLSRRVQHQIVRKINLSFDTITRPESWEMLNCAVKETFPTLAKVGSNAAVGKTHALVLSHTQSGANLLSHMYHYLHGMDVQVERLADDDFPHVRAAYRARGIRFIRPSVLWPAVFDWLKKLGVDIIEPDNLVIKAHNDGSGEIRTAKATFDIQRIVLADEGSIQQYAGATIIERFFTPVETTSLLLQPGSDKVEHIVVSPEYGFCAQTDNMGHVICMANTSILRMSDLLNSNIGARGRHFHLSGRSVFTKLLSRDGAPVVGKLGRSSLWGIAGLGHGDIFFASALARLIAGNPSEREADYFGMRGADSKRSGRYIQDKFKTNFGPRNE